MGILRFFTAGVLAAALSGCYTDFEPKVDVEPVLCVNCIVTAGEPIEPKVTRTWLYTDTNGAQHNAVDDATVTIYANGQAVSANYLPKAGDLIRIHASSGRYGEADGEVRVPDAVPVGDVEFEPKVSYIYYDEQDGVAYFLVTFVMGLRVAIPDPANVENYYHYGLSSYGSDETEYEPDGNYFAGVYSGGLDFKYEPIFGEHISAIESVIGADSYGFTFFTDRQFSGKTYWLNIKYTRCEANFVLPVEELDAGLDCGFTVRLSSLSESYYNWYNYCWHEYDGLLGDLQNVGLGEPLSGYSNVSTHAGVIAARNVSEYKIDLRAFLEGVLQEGL